MSKIVEIVVRNSRTLEPVAGWRMSEDKHYIDNSSPHLVTTMYIPLTLREATYSALQLHRAIAESSSPKAMPAKEAIPRLDAAVTWLSDQGLRYLEILQDPKILGVMPGIHWQTFVKQSD